MDGKRMFRHMPLMVCLILIAGLLQFTHPASNAAGAPIEAPAAAPPQGDLAAPLADVPQDFSDTVVATVASPTALAFTPDGRMIITTQPGVVRIVQNGSLLATPALTLGTRVCTDFERGLLGVAVEPSFATSQRIFLYYTFNKFNSCARNASNSPVNRVSRFTLATNNTINPASEVVLVDNIASPNGNHNAGDLQFGKDGMLYISAGDGGCQLTVPSNCAGSNQNARRRDILSGKVLRIRPDGTIPPDNPWVNMAGARRCGDPAGVPAGTGPCSETFAWGLRNPFRLGFDPNAASTRFFINDVGQNVWEEIDLAQAGADYGWSVREGNCATGSTTNCGAPPAGMTNPIFAYGRDSGCASITGGAFVPNGLWPASFNGAYMYSDFVCGRIFTLRNVGGTFTSEVFATALGGSSAVHLLFGPDGASQALYYTSFASGGQVRRIRFTGTANRPPTAVIAASPTSGAAPLTVNFNGGGSSDPDGDALTYLWTFGDGATSQTSTPTTSHTYSANGAFTAQLVVRDSRGATSAPVTIRIDVGNTPPVPQIVAPTTSSRFRVGQTITLQGRATDAQDGTIPDQRLSWRVILHHNTHTHPFVPPTTGNNITFTAPAPEDLAATENSFLEIELTATDSQGASSVITQRFDANRVNVTFNTVPSGLNLVVNDTTIAGPRTLVSWEGYILNVNAPNQVDGTGRSWVFSSWSDGGAAAHMITTPASPASLTATFVESTSTVVFSDNFETNTGWTANPSGTDTATTGRWERGDPEPTDSSGPKQLGTTVSGVNDLSTARLAGASAGANDIDGGTTSIRSPAITLPSSANLTLSFSFYLAHGTNSSTADFFRVRIVGASSTTTVFEELGGTEDDDAAWASRSVSLNSFAGQTIRILIEAADAGTASLVEAAVDDVRIMR